MPTMTPAGVDFIDRAPLRVDTVVLLKQTPQQVWDVLVDTERWPDWFRSCTAARATSDPPDGVGSTRWIHVELFKVNERIIVWDEAKRWGFTLLDANLPVADTIVELATLEPIADGTRLTYTFAIAPKPWLRPLKSVMRWKFHRMFGSSLAGLQPYLDGLPR
jgi:uncharacterized protein YndB with AHSA1/START domain